MQPGPHQASREVTILRRLLRTLWPVLQGSVVLLRRPCTRRGCARCATGDKHPATYLSLRRAGKTQLVYLPASLIREVTRGVQNYRRLQAAVAAATRPWVEARKPSRRPPR
ncbi:MAG: DUF6788 family protein [Candidatus Rokuibacteriota bacterium]